ncbi:MULTISPECIES: thiamine phosphate synthase [Clostridium]|jgi:thiamine-phosphate diphosphorylase|uniref:Thiamine-phosphate synthase n=2 Tax=Clostridium beijerinckii TaxID=1520 RepID=THIE_CLOB8|nr:MULTISPECIES: thiamine phosphate synthase [Clostridium]A6M1W6.1 RecName: Full=Thiamine-phosphate synthase; Short=TP synthase; Short=TPS; AltName: Full=Thiamine-phosphate pyrophosphorylase; Short=TMP pyrophosphorylase; Short=TMP-PPase [Clostridium beijerinckii NCIMB 8052]ABR36596.1 thiamine-phosphate pyrophosphorylase [Clostridium beijerinckii NCIMB 8052]AIU04722.1 thiamine-phosphate pyrophosphorylase [Clostridium beijerinckii ATCC 35702]MBE6091371.1 thiamine phosphate synthase [Clostridium b
MKPKIDYSIYLVTDRDLMSTETLEEAVEKAIIGGCTLIQLREKDCSSLDFYNTAVRVKEITDKHNIPLIINDRVDIALAVDAAGVHVGQSDIPAAIVRKVIGNDKILGVSTGSVNEALEAEKNGADYLGVGAMYSTGTKKDADSTSMNELRKIRENVSIPIVVIGGINKDRVKDFKGIGIDGLAIVSAIIAKEDITTAAKELKNEFIKI